MKAKTQGSKLKTHRKALITGITGQDGSYLAELLLSKGYEVHGILRRASQFNTHRIDHIYQDPHEKGRRLRLHYGDLNDASSLNKLIRDVRPDEIYNLAAQSHVKVSFDVPEYTGEITGLGTIRMLEAIREAGFQTRFYQASSSELFGKVVETPQTEKTPFYPRSPYAAAKAYAYYVTRNYREAYGMFACNGILFNHESPRRGETFVTRKITRAVARIKYGLQNTLFLGNLDAKRDWGFAGDYVEAMWLMLQRDEPDDYVVATGETHSVREFAEAAFEHAGMELEWKETRDERRETRVKRRETRDERSGHSTLGSRHSTIQGVERKTGKALVMVDPRYFRPTEVDMLLGDASKARRVLGWKPKVKFHELVKTMVAADLEMVRRQVEGYRERVCEKEMH